MPESRTFAVVTLGCKANQYDSETLAAGLASRGYAPAPLSEAGLVVVNGCAVTASASGRVRRELRRVRRANPRATLAVAGCLARCEGEGLAAGGEADLVLFDPPGWGEDAPPRVLRAGDRRSRPLLKIQDGCDRACAYCLVPSLRGSPRSLPPSLVLSRLSSMMEEGAAEVALTGIHLGLYGRDLSPRSGLEDLLERFLASPSPGRVRLSSLDAGEAGDRLVGLVAGSRGRICPHFHFSLQSGSGRILAAMGRGGDGETVRAAVRRVRRAMPEAGVGCDLIAGFPGEGEDDFARSLGLVEELSIPFVHAFPFSPRPGTRAAGMPDDVPPPVKRDRVRRLAEAGRRNLAGFLAAFPGKSLEVVFEGGRDRATGRRRARAGNYLPVLVAGAGTIPRGSAARVAIAGVAGGGLLGEVSR